MTLTIASQLPADLTTLFAHATGMDIRSVSVGPPILLPPDVEVLIASPAGMQSDDPSPARPTKWPFALKWIHLTSVGIDFYPEWMFDGVVVTSACGTSATALAEFALAAIFAKAKGVPDIWISDPARWMPSPISMVQGATLGIVGFGAIGEALAPRAQALGMDVLAVRRSHAPIGMAGVEQVDLPSLFERSDHIVLAVPATPETRHMVGRELLALAKPDLHLVNIARGSLIDDDALLGALDDGRVGCASLDVTEPEPLPAGHRYYTHPRVRLSPHTSVHTAATLHNVVSQFSGNLDRFRNRTPLEGVVDRERGY